MKVVHNKKAILIFIVILVATTGYHCSSSRKSAETETVEVINTNASGTGMKVSVAFTKGEAHNYPLMAIWLEDTSGNYLETLFIAESIGKGVFQHADRSKGSWKAGPIRRPAALPYWGHQRGVQAADGYYLPTPEDPMPDAVTGPTPKGDFLLNSIAGTVLPDQFVVLMEINQSWDWNEFWTNNKFPDDQQYKTSSQPSLVYAARIDLTSGDQQVVMQPIGHGHYSGKDGELYTDLSTMTTAMDIVKSATVTIWK
jgi:hypothetical protein